MQLGNLAVIPISAAVAAWRRRWRLAAGLLLAGLGTYFGAKVVKGLVPRGRPDDLLHDVVIRGAAAVGRGFPSGHAAVVAAIVAVAWPWLGRRARIACVVLALAVCWARVYVAAHLPLDVVGGAALGLALAGLVRLILGRPA
jgi:undecaprenyl-diphosphatase